MNTETFFASFLAQVMETPQWKTMERTVENSPWHRESSVAVHTLMCLEQYMGRFYEHRTDAQRLLSLLTITFHDVGKPEAEETLEKKEEPGVFYRRYAGHEPISGNEFMSLMMSRKDLREQLFAQGLTYEHLRQIKVMIEHHLPYGLKNPEKRKNLRKMLAATLGENEVCFYDCLRSDAAGRISDDHATKLANVETWIEEFQQVSPRGLSYTAHDGTPTLTLVVGVSGVGKSTWIREHAQDTLVFSEDDLRVQYAMGAADFDWEAMSESERYDEAWQFCHLHKESKYDAFMKQKWAEAVASGKNITLDRMNHGRKGRAFFINSAKQKGYQVRSVEFWASEELATSRQLTRADKRVPANRVHQLYMQQETPWLGVEVDWFEVVPCK